MKKYLWLLVVMALVLLPLLAACKAAAPKAPAEPTKPAPTVPAPTTPAVPTTPTVPTAPATPITAGPPQIPHTLEGRSDCLLCHGATGIKPYPADHAGRTNDLCRACHQPAS